MHVYASRVSAFLNYSSRIRLVLTKTVYSRNRKKFKDLVSQFNMISFSSGFKGTRLTGQNTTDLQHYVMIKTLNGRHCLCPKNETATSVLDLGTGTGIWAIEYGKFIY